MFGPMPAEYGPCSSSSSKPPSAAPAQPAHTVRRARRSSRPAGHTVSTIQAPPSSASPAKEIHRLIAKACAVSGLPVVDAPTLPLASGPLPTTKRIVPETGCESADTTRKLAV